MVKKTINAFSYFWSCSLWRQQAINNTLSWRPVLFGVRVTQKPGNSASGHSACKLGSSPWMPGEQSSYFLTCIRDSLLTTDSGSDIWVTLLDNQSSISIPLGFAFSWIVPILGCSDPFLIPKKVTKAQSKKCLPGENFCPPPVPSSLCSLLLSTSQLMPRVRL